MNHALLQAGPGAISLKPEKYRMAGNFICEGHLGSKTSVTSGLAHCLDRDFALTWVNN